MRIRAIMSVIALALGLLLCMTATAPISAGAAVSDDARISPPVSPRSGATAAAALPRCTHLSIYGESVHINYPSVGAGTRQIDCKLSYGDHNWGVVALQQWLHFCGAPQVEIDGIYGPITRDAIIWVQATYGLTVDGVYGPQTRVFLQKAVFSNANQFLRCAVG
jgi:hypothetical protein